MQIHNELADLWWECFRGLSRPTLLPRWEEALHPIFFKLIRFSGQRALGDIDFFCSLPCGFVEQDERFDLLVKLLSRRKPSNLNVRQR